MTNLWKRYRAWHVGNQQFSPERWAEIRAKGRGQFVLRKMFPFTVYAVAIYDVGSQLFYHGQPFEYGFYIFQFAVSGIWFGYSEWQEQENKYKKALNSSPQTSVQPH